MLKNRSKNQQLTINMAASILTFLVGLAIRFLLTPYIVNTLGAEAYGFVILASNILSYTTLITVALNSMAGRFITIRYIEGNINEANKYFSSVFYSNLILGAVILLFSIGCVIWLEYLIHIPEDLLFDVQILFSLLAFNNIIGLITNIWGVATFIKNRLDLSNIRSIIGNLIRATLLVLLFMCFSPHIWYVGVAGMALTLYTAFTNRRFTKILTPDLYIKLNHYQWIKVKELLSSGVWNLVSKLGEIMGQGLDLLIANLCISVSAMGYFAITKNVPFLILGLFGTISNVFAPILTGQYAQGNTEDMVHELKKSIRILSLFTAVPLTCLYIYGDYFYRLWLPTEDSGKLQLLTILGTLALPYTLPLESLWNIFTITNKLKYTTLFMLANNLLVFIIVMSSMLIVDSLETRLLILAGTRSICGLIRGLIFLPIYGAQCLRLSYRTFYKSICRSLLCLTICFGICYIERFFIIADTWLKLLGACVLVVILCIGVSMVVVLTRSDRLFLYQKFVKRTS